MAFLQIEETVEALFNELYPRHAPGIRAVKPLLAPALGCLVVDPNIRQLLPHREYHQLDMVDFLDYSTSSLPSTPRLRDFAKNEINFYEGFDRKPNQPMLHATEMGIGLSILGVALARNEVFVSVTMQFMVHGEGFTDSHLVTLTFAPSKTEFPNGEGASLEEWDRYSIFQPTPTDNEWRFVVSGVYTDHVLEEMARRPHVEGAATKEQIAAIRSDASENKTKFSTFFELARLGLHLPAYFGFMYDLVVNEEAHERTSVIPPSTAAPPKPTREPTNPSYKIIKSIRIIRPADPSHSQRTWSAPTYRFSVRGHWRHYSDSSVAGRTAEGLPIQGRTWVRTYMKGPGLSVDDTESATAEPRVTIKIKQPLSYAQDIIAAHERENTPHASSSQPAPGPRTEKPSDEWKARERSKLTAGLRYAMMRRDRFRCCLCGRNASEENGVRLEVDHRIPVDQWGTTTEGNLWTLCLNCNRGKSNDAVEPSGPP